MKIQTPFNVPPKYFNIFQNHFNNDDEKLVSYTYIPEYLKKPTVINAKNSVENQLNNNLTYTK